MPQDIKRLIEDSRRRWWNYEFAIRQMDRRGTDSRLGKVEREKCKRNLNELLRQQAREDGEVVSPGGPGHREGKGER